MKTLTFTLCVAFFTFAPIFTVFGEESSWLLRGRHPVNVIDKDDHREVADEHGNALVLMLKSEFVVESLLTKSQGVLVLRTEFKSVRMGNGVKVTAFSYGRILVIKANLGMEGHSTLEHNSQLMKDRWITKLLAVSADGKAIRAEVKGRIEGELVSSVKWIQLSPPAFLEAEPKDGHEADTPAPKADYRRRQPRLPRN